MNKKALEKNLLEEAKIQEEIENCLNEAKSFFFDAGAGAGKTFALVKSIEYILQDENKRNLQENCNQKILCITYTNAAKNEIINRIGHNSGVIVSTIHDFLWNFISKQQKLLWEQHKSRLLNEVQKINKKLSTTFYESIPEKSLFKEKIYDKDFLEFYYANKDKHAADFRNKINSYDDFFSNYLKSVNKFKNVVKSLINLRDYRNALKEKHKIYYNPIKNRDNLANYVISHDTLLDYCKNIIKKNELLRRLLLDSYPFVFVDEYQDTDRRVIEIISSVKDYADKNEKRFVVGYFGDTMQNIYEKGVGTLPNCNKYKQIKKKFNRRSTTKIVSIIEKIRNDGFGQEAINPSNNNGLCKFYLTSTNFDLNTFLGEHKLRGKTACLLLKNKDIAKKRQFDDLLTAISQFPRFKGGNQGNINTEFLQKNQQRIGWFLRDVLTFVDFVLCIKDNSSTVGKIISFMPKSSNRVTFNELSKLIGDIRSKLKNIKLMTLEECLEEIRKVNDGDKIIENIFLIKNESKELISSIKEKATNYLLYSKQEQMELLDQFFKVQFIQFINWYDYVFDNNSGKKINYYTLHGSKGLEFDNVVVVLGDNFAQRKDYCRYFFYNYDNNNLKPEEKEKFDKVRNLLYVACSRARKNLYIIYETDQNKDSKLRRIVNLIFPNVEYDNISHE